MQILVFAKHYSFIDKSQTILKAFLNFQLDYFLEDQIKNEKIETLIGDSYKIAVAIIDPLLDNKTIFQILDQLNQVHTGSPVVVLSNDPNFFRSDMIGGKFQEVNNFYSLDLEWDRKQIVEIRGCLNDILSQHPNSELFGDFEKPIDEDFFSIRVQNFNRFKSVPTDIYSRTDSDEYEIQFLANEEIDKEKIKRLIANNQKDCFLLKEGHLKFINFCIKDLIRAFRKGFSSDKERHICHIQAYNITSQQFKVIGPSEELLLLNKLMFESSFEMMKNYRDLFGLLEEFGPLNYEYRFEHSVLASYVSYSMVKNMNWTSGIAEKKLSLAFLLHDITLTTDEMARIQSKNDPEYLALTAEEKEIYHKHPSDAADYIKYFNGYPLEIQFIILDHHEKPQGTGFPAGKSLGKIPPLSCVFILAHELITDLYATEFNKKQIIISIKQMQLKYKGKHFEQALEGLSKAFSIPYEYKQVI